MNLVLDVGNTQVKYGLYQGKRLFKSETVLNSSIPKYDIGKKIKSYSIPQNIAICSSNKPLSQKIKKVLKKVFVADLVELGKDIDIQFHTKYRDTKELGLDRKVNIYGAMLQLKPPFLVISFGTAVTIDYISQEFCHEGGFILPGVRMSSLALAEYTSSLPKVDVRKKRSFYGKSTSECINNGIIYGIMSSIQFFIEKVSSLEKCQPTVLITGGDYHLFKKTFSGSVLHKPNHTLDSLNILLSNHSFGS